MLLARPIDFAKSENINNIRLADTSQAVAVSVLHVVMLSEGRHKLHCRRQTRTSMCGVVHRTNQCRCCPLSLCRTQESSVLHFQPLSAPLLPAHAVIVDEGRKQLLLLVRGTSSWADCLTDIVAHTEPLGSGRYWAVQVGLTVNQLH